MLPLLLLLLLLLRFVARSDLMMRTAVRAAVVTAEGGCVGRLRVDGLGIEERRRASVRVDRRLDRVCIDEGRVGNQFRGENSTAAAADHAATSTDAVAERQIPIVVVEMTVV